jgi:hypothetical protein
MRADLVAGDGPVLVLGRELVRRGVGLVDRRHPWVVGVVLALGGCEAVAVGGEQGSVQSRQWHSWRCLQRRGGCT